MVAGVETMDVAGVIIREPGWVVNGMEEFTGKGDCIYGAPAAVMIEVGEVESLGWKIRHDDRGGGR